jgi:integrase
VLQRWFVRREELRRAAGPAWAGSDRLFTDEIGRPVKPDRVYRRLLAIAGPLELPRLDVHGLRHSYATAALRAGVPVHVVSARLGHADPSLTLQVYAHVLQGDDHAAAETAASAILGADGDPKVGVVDHS